MSRLSRHMTAAIPVEDAVAGDLYLAHHFGQRSPGETDDEMAARYLADHFPERGAGDEEYETSGLRSTPGWFR